MSESTQIIVIAIILMFVVTEVYHILYRLRQLENNQEILRIAFNKLSEEITNENRNTNALQKQKEQSENNSESEN